MSTKATVMRSSAVAILCVPVEVWPTAQVNSFAHQVEEPGKRVALTGHSYRRWAGNKTSTSAPSGIATPGSSKTLPLWAIPRQLNNSAIPSSVRECGRPAGLGVKNVIDLLNWQKIGRGDRIRTCDLMLPKHALYQAEPRPEDIRIPDSWTRCLRT